MSVANAVNLVKGGNVSLTKTDSTLTNIRIGLGWDIATSDAETFDLDAAVIMVGPNEKARSDLDFIFYHHKESTCGSVQHTGDNKTGAGEGDDETINVFLDKVPTDVHKLIICVSIYDAVKRKQNFGQVDNTFVRLVNAKTEQEIVRFNLTENASTESAMVFAEVYRYEGEWKFKALAQGFESLVNLLHKYGIQA